MRVFSFFSRLPDAAVYAILFALCVPAFWINLDRMPFIGDEGIRSTVALEMHLSGNYIVPTLNGDPYFNKPPLYNWVLLGARAVFGSFGEWPARNTTLFFLGLFACTVYVHVRRAFDPAAGVLAALMLVSSGRMLFWDSMLGLIDVCFSWLMYLNWMLLYAWGRKGYWWRLFAVSYALMAAGFLLKGLPAVVFQAISVPTALVLLGQWRRLFSGAHIAGGVLGVLLAGAYYAVYAGQVSLDQAFGILLDQSLQRTVTHFGWGQTLLHLFTFPAEQVYHFLPWSLLLVLVFHPRFWRWVQDEPFVRYNFWMMCANLPVYWSSVEVYPRYLLMFIPVFNVVFYYVLTTDSGRLREVLGWVFRVLGVLVLLVVAGLPLVERLHQLPLFYAGWAITLLLAIAVCWALWADRRRALFWTVGVVLVVRIGLNLFVIPFRTEEAKFGWSREDARRIAARFPGQHICLHQGADTDNVARFYIENETRQIVFRCAVPPPETLFLVERARFSDIKGEVLDSIRIFDNRFLHLMRVEHDR